MMLSPEEANKIRTAAGILRTESRRYYDKFKQYSDGITSSSQKAAREALERNMELDKIANELDVIAEGNL